MAEKGNGKGVVQAVVPKKKQNGDPAWNIIIDGIEYYDSKGEFKDKQGQEVDFEWADSNDGKIKFIHIPGSYQGGGGRRGGGGKSPEELKQTLVTMAFSYAKDISLTTLANIQKELNKPAEYKTLDYYEVVAKTTARITAEIGKQLVEEMKKTI